MKNNIERYRELKSYKLKENTKVLDRLSRLEQSQSTRFAIAFGRIQRSIQKSETVKTSTSTPPIDHIQTAIQQSRAMLSLEDDWDSEGATAILLATWERATESFLWNSASQLWRLYKICLDAPDISPVSDGSIDIHWQKEGYELLVNVPAEPHEPLRYYGDNRLGQIVKGSFDLTTESMALNVADAVDMLWESENIPNVDLLYMRVHHIQIGDDGQVKPGAFRDIGNGMSTDWAKYSTAEDAKLRSKIPRDNAVISMVVGAVREIPNQEVTHTPTPHNRAHTDVIGNKRGGDPETRVLFRRIAMMVIPYVPENGEVLPQ